MDWTGAHPSCLVGPYLQARYSMPQFLLQQNEENMRLSDACKMFNVYGWVVETTGNDRCRSSKGRPRLFSAALLIIPDAVVMESNFLTHLSHKYPILDSSGTVGGVRISGESELQDHNHQKYISLFIIIKYL